MLTLIIGITVIIGLQKKLLNFCEKENYQMLFIYAKIRLVIRDIL